MPDELLSLEIAYIKDSLAEIKTALQGIHDMRRDLDRLQDQHDERCDISNDMRKEFTAFREGFQEYKNWAQSNFMPKNAPNKFREQLVGWLAAILLVGTFLMQASGLVARLK